MAKKKKSIWRSFSDEINVADDLSKSGEISAGIISKFRKKKKDR